MRRALLDAAARLLPDRAPSTVSGRELAHEAGVNYGLIHHYFGSKDAVFRAGLFQLRDEFLARHDDPEQLRLITVAGDPYLRALARSQMDYPSELGEHDGAPLANAIRRGVAARSPAANDGDDADVTARTIALMSLQLAFGVFQDMLLDATGASETQRPQVEAALRRVYDGIAWLPPEAT